ncbi:universal stress protein [Winogradskyella tangerina]|uniref:universal stress protein n=1 Tax=Winogradskyella tangerina TaxID=2023240 RepID=UPI000DBE7193|nr:universal stress protein [Winogradskyella tangerina]
MKNILLPTDFSENSWNAIEYALRFFEDMACNFYLLHVISFNHFIPVDESPSIDQTYIDNTYTIPANKKLGQFLKRISELKMNQERHRFFTFTDVNFFVNSIRKNTKEKQIDLIVMGTKGASGLNKIIMGTNTADVITKVKCNTLAVPENAKFIPPKEIAFPTDLALTYHIQVLQPMVEVIDHFDAALRILHINKNKQPLKDELKQNLALIEDYFYNKPSSFHYLSNRKVEDAVQCFVESRDIDLICMVAKNLNYFQQILFHSRIERISYHTDKPFLVLHENKT